MSTTPYFINTIIKFNSAFTRYGNDSKQYKDIERKFRSLFINQRREFPYHDLLLISPSGNILFSLLNEYELGANVNTQKIEYAPLKKVFIVARKFLKIEISEFNQYENCDYPSAFLATPVFFEGQMIGVIAVRVNSKGIFNIIQDYSGLGDTGEILIARKEKNDVLFIVPLRFDHSAALKRRVSIGSDIAVPVQKAVLGKN